MKNQSKERAKEIAYELELKMEELITLHVQNISEEIFQEYNECMNADDFTDCYDEIEADVRGLLAIRPITL